MTPKEFFDTVVELRKHQRAFERSHGRDTLSGRYAKDIARRIDEEIVRVQLIQKEKQQPTLDFNN